MDKFDQLSNSSMIFTLTETDNKQDVSTVGEDWEKDLERLRSSRLARESGEIPPEEAETLLKHIQQATLHTHASALSGVSSNQFKKFNDAELDAAYAEYLHQCEVEHNSKEGVDQEDVGILMQEDWLQAQSALQFERNRRDAQPLQTLVFGKNGEVKEVSSDTLVDEAGEQPSLPEFAVHVYALPEMPATRKLKIISEKELVDSLCAKLTPHLANAVAGMVKQILQKKLATLSYELQMQFNEETPQLVQDVLKYNLDNIVRTVKYQLNEK